MNEEIKLEELKAVLIESIEKKKKENAYQHPLLLYVNHIEAMVKSGARHRDIAEFFNQKLKLEGSSKFNNNRLANVRAYWKKKNLIDFNEVNKLITEFSKPSNTNELLELKNLYQEVFRTTQRTVDNHDLKNFYRNNYRSGLSINELARKYVASKNNNQNNN